MPATRCFQLLGLITLLLVASFLEPRLAWIALALDLVLAVATLVDFRLAARTPLAASRSWPSLLVQEAPAEVTVSLTTQASSPVTVLLREGLHPSLAEGPLRRLMTIHGPGELRWTWNFTPRRRGEHRTGPLTVRVLGPWRLAWAQRELLPAEAVRVYPQVRWEGRAGQLLVLAQRRRMGQIPLRIQGVGTEPYALREYLPGDPIAKIHWKATARHGRPVSREETWERSGRLIVLLECARAMASMDGSRSKLDYAVAATLALTRVAAARGDQVTIVAFADRVLRTVRVRSGGRGAALAYEALYDVEAELVEPAYDLAAEAALDIESRRATAVLFTSVVDLAAAELLRESLLRLGRRHRALLLNLEDPDLRRLATATPSTPILAFAQVASLEIQLANRRLARHLRRGGIRVVNTPADRLALEALEAYLAIYRNASAAVPVRV
ncbi:MAG TPA: DUF58 domain-containing protein [Thermoanaerobaculia bacterium]|jgi:uncharacterized protein (DUF58 family)|nr:DUF58 domain-containing protein [Thermoanaerobaculia bacterium]